MACNMHTERKQNKEIQTLCNYVNQDWNYNAGITGQVFKPNKGSCISE